MCICYCNRLCKTDLVNDSEVKCSSLTGPFSIAGLSTLPKVPPNIPSYGYGEVKMTLYLSILSTLQYLPVSIISTQSVTGSHVTISVGHVTTSVSHVTMIVALFM